MWSLADHEGPTQRTNLSRSIYHIYGPTPLCKDNCKLADDHTPNETAQQLFFLFRLQVPLPPEVGQRTSQITQWKRNKNSGLANVVRFQLR
jgi:hypothetical protein